jgi:hypothetical protein
MQDHDSPLVDRQAAELASESVTLREVSGLVDSVRRFVVGHHVQLDLVPPPSLACQPIAGTHGQAVEPGIPRIRIPESSNVAPGQLERLLDRVLGAFRVTEDEPGDGVQPGKRRSHQDGERVVLTCLGSFDELSLHVATGTAWL